MKGHLFPLFLFSSLKCVTRPPPPSFAQAMDCLTILPRSKQVFITRCTAARNNRLQQWFVELA